MSDPSPPTQPTRPTPALEERGISVIRGLAIDAVQRAKSGHPGTPLALAPLAHVLWTRILRYNGSDPEWFDRDRFILSAGHASMLLYAMLHLTGTHLSLDDLRAFRQLGSKTPGHPELHFVPGADVTTGPLGQGFANAVGMALAERATRTRFGEDICNHRIFGICSDGDLQEGVSHEAASLAGHQQLGHLNFIYDDNAISIDGPTSLSFSEDIPARFRSYGWHVVEVGDHANDLDALENALQEAVSHTSAPSLVVLRSHIGYPSPTYTDTAFAHGNPLGEEEVAKIKEKIGLDPNESFVVPDDVYAMYQSCGQRGAADAAAWHSRVDALSTHDRAAFDAAMATGALAGWHNKLPTWEIGSSLATRVAVGECLNAAVDQLPSLLIGGADLTANTGTSLTTVPADAAMSPSHPDSKQIFWGIREHAMAAAMTGAALHGGILPIGGTFFVFSDYQKPALRLAAMGEAHLVHIWSHDSIGLGEDGPTHQPIEQLAGLRAMPGLRLFRPADANETAHALRIAIDSPGPTCLVLTRQATPVLEGTQEAFAGVSNGAYVIWEHAGAADAHVGNAASANSANAAASLDLVLVATGSEVAPTIDAAQLLADEGYAVRVVSMPSWDRFAATDETYKESVFPSGVIRLGVEAATSFGWDRWVDAMVSLDRFGASAPAKVLFETFGFTSSAIAARAKSLLQQSPQSEEPQRSQQ